MSDESSTIDQAPGVKCLFTEKDWEDWEEIDNRTKGRGAKFKAGGMSYTYKRVICILCNPKREMAITKLRNHYHRNHNKDMLFWGWSAISKYEKDCEEEYIKSIKNKVP